VISEIIRPDLLGAFAITITALILAVVLLRGRTFGELWPLLPLFIYVFFPEAYPRVAVIAFALASLSWLISARWLLPERFQWLTKDMVIVSVIFGTFLTLYILTLAPDILPADNGEFQLAATTLGVAHPPGFPLYTMLAFLMTKLPFAASPAYKVNLLSAFTSTMTLVFVYLTVKTLTHSRIASVVTVIALASATTFWAQATTANIRSLTAMFAAMSIYALVKVRQSKEGQLGHKFYSLETRNSARRLTTRTSKSTLIYTFLFATVLFFGIVHHGSLVFMGLIFILVLILINPSTLKSGRIWIAVLIAALLALIPLVYLPTSALTGSPSGPENLNTISGFIDYILARGFQGDFFYFDEPAVLWERLIVIGNVMTFQFSTVLLLGMLAGLILLFWKHWVLALLLGGSFAVLSIVAATYRAPQTVEYMLPAYVPAAICLGYALGSIRAIVPTPLEGRKGNMSPVYIVSTLLVAVVLIAAVTQGLDKYPSFALLHEDTTARDYAGRLLDEAPDASVILSDWHWVTPLWYLQEVEGMRPDVSVQFVFPTVESYADTWARRIKEELQKGRPVIATHFDEITYMDLPNPEPIHEAFLYRQEARTTLPTHFKPLSIELGSSLEIVGYEVLPVSAQVGEESVLTLAWQPADDLNGVPTLFAHLVGEDGTLYAHQDLPTFPQSSGLTLTQFRLVPRSGAEFNELSIMIGAYLQEPLVDERGQERTTLTTLDVQAASLPPYTRNESYRPLADDSPGRTLVGYDWDNSLADSIRLYLHWQTEQGYHTETLDTAEHNFEFPDWIGPWGLKKEGTSLAIETPSYYVPFAQGIVWTGEPIGNTTQRVPGQEVELVQFFSASIPVMRDLIISTRLVGYEADNFHWDWWDLDDGVPAMGAIPTLKWISGSEVRDPRWPMVSDSAFPGQTLGPLLRLYDAFTSRPLAILDERISEETPWVPIGTRELGRT
jgi:hypothetical protein